MCRPYSDPEQLLGLARAGDSSALGQLLQLYRGYLELLARLQIGRRLQGKADAADLVQETFLQAHVHFAQFHPSSRRTRRAPLLHRLGEPAAPGAAVPGSQMVAATKRSGPLFFSQK